MFKTFFIILFESSAQILEKYYKSVFHERKVEDCNGLTKWAFQFVLQTILINFSYFCTTNDATQFPPKLLLMRSYEAHGDAKAYGEIPPGGSCVGIEINSSHKI